MSYKLMVQNNVSRETFASLQIYTDLLQQWNAKFNLISRKQTQNNIWRTILDSLSLEQHIANKNNVILDIGSGAGFPILILAICGYTNCIGVERNIKKAVFLQEVARQTSTLIDVRDIDVRQVHDVRADIITSKAVTRTSELMRWSEHIVNKKTNMFVYKNSVQIDEIIALNKVWNFNLSKHPLAHNPSTEIWHIANISKRR